MSFGVTPAGFVRKTLAEIKASLETGWRGIFGTNTDLSESTPDAQIIGLFAGALDEAWQAAAGVYSSFRPSQAAGQALSDIVQFNGITRKGGTRSRVFTVITTTGAVLVTTGSRFSSAAGDLFRPLADAALINGSSLQLEAVEVGPIAVGAGELTTIVTPLANLVSLTNGAPNFVTGTLEESDSDLRKRQIVSTEMAASNILEALYSALLNVSGVSDVRIYVNATAGTVDGRPSNSYEIVILGGTNLDIANAIWQHHPAGIELFGSTSQVIVDSQGNNQTIEFTRPTPVLIYVDVTVAPTVAYPDTGDDDIKQAILDYAAGLLVAGEKFGIGDDVLVSRIYSATNSVPGNHVTALLVDDVDPPVAATDIVIDETEIASFVLANIDVHS